MSQGFAEDVQGSVAEVGSPFGVDIGEDATARGLRRDAARGEADRFGAAVLLVGGAFA
ncbi:hypothetical protein NRB20_61200 [Nocardia sp. RB20]|uniref:Uncharacterized protein n=1 Tax=Nocardia macrotermitis TaxID=2585198 RepID=A0A7K0DB24_9NOCA|nr:hypothetical protein [Nocardia macrotermitis]